MQQSFKCVEPFDWNGSSYMVGLYYTDRGGEAYAAFRAMAAEAVADGRFIKEAREIPGASVAGKAVLKEKTR